MPSTLRRATFPFHEADSEVLSFSPADELKAAEAAMMKNMQEMQDE